MTCKDLFFTRWWTSLSRSSFSWREAGCALGTFLPGDVGRHADEILRAYPSRCRISAAEQWTGTGAPTHFHETLHARGQGFELSESGRSSGMNNSERAAGKLVLGLAEFGTPPG